MAHDTISAKVNKLFRNILIWITLIMNRDILRREKKLPEISHNWSMASSAVWRKTVSHMALGLMSVQSMSHWMNERGYLVNIYMNTNIKEQRNWDSSQQLNSAQHKLLETVEKCKQQQNSEINLAREISENAEGLSARARRETFLFSYHSVKRTHYAHFQVYTCV